MRNTQKTRNLKKNPQKLSKAYIKNSQLTQ